MIIANETRSRRSWMNSLISIAQVRRRKPPDEGLRGVLWRRTRSLEVVLRPAHEIDEDVLERGSASAQVSAGRSR